MRMLPLLLMTIVSFLPATHCDPMDFCKDDLKNCTSMLTTHSWTYCKDNPSNNGCKRTCGFCPWSMPCQHPGPVANAVEVTPVKQWIAPGDYVQYACLNRIDTIVSGNKARVCSGDGPLLGLPPVCKPSCKDAYYDCDNALSTDRRWTLCKKNIDGKMENSCRRTCGFCEGSKPCPHPGPVANAVEVTPVKASITPGDFIEYRCLYEPKKGNSGRVCGPDGTFSGSPPVYAGP